MKLCSVEGCGRKHKALGFCEMHRKRFKKSGDPLLGASTKGQLNSCSIKGCKNSAAARGLCGLHYLRLKRSSPDLFGACSVDGCSRPRWAKELCERHYRHLRKTGDPLGSAKPQKLWRFIQEVALQHSGKECLLWPFCHTRGYGSIRHNGRHSRVNRVICELVYGPPQDERLEAAHSCGNQACVAPAHLRWATSKENKDDTLRHGTRARGSRHGASKLTEAQVSAIREQTHRTQKAFARELGVTQSLISAIRARKIWTSI